MDNQLLINLICRSAVLLLLLPIHEYAHARAAYALGDPTAANAGRLDLNPLVHLDPVGSLLLLVAGVGWAKPVPVDTRYFKHPRRDMVLTALAGPLANLLMAFLFILLAQVTAGFYLRGYYAGSSLLDSHYYLILFLNTVASISVSLAVFNLLPVPPLDGSQLLEGLLPRSVRGFYYRYARAINSIFLMLLLFTDLFTDVIYFFGSRVLDVMYLVTDFIPLLFV